MSPKLRQAILSSSALIAGCLSAVPSLAASHREAPLIATDPTADNTDTYAFVSYDRQNLKRDPVERRVTFIANVLPGQDPADGPNYFEFDPRVLYKISIDNNQDGVAEDIVYEFRFQTETRSVGAQFPLPYLGNPNIAAPGLQGITALDGPGSEGLTRRQSFTVTEVRAGHRTPLFQGQKLFAVPSNVGPATMPDYEDLASQGIYSDPSTGVRVFAGQRAETFAIDLGAVFDTVNLRRSPPVLNKKEDANDDANPFGVNRFSGTDVHTMAIEVPITRITSDGKPAPTTAYPVVGMYASTGRPTGNGGHPVQVSRLANPLVNELIINTPAKDRWNATAPQNEAQFQDFYRTPSIATALNLIFGLPVPQTPRQDLVQLLLKYPGQALDGGNCGFPCAELLRLDLRVKPISAENQKRLGGLAGDAAGFPNGRRPNDDVTDIAIRVVGGSAFITNRVGDGVNFANGVPGAGMSDGPGYGDTMNNRLDVTNNGIAKEFPFLPTPHDGRNRRHIDCSEKGGNPCN
jgi:hypothetical protein